MFDAVVEAVSGSSWSYVIVFAIAAIDVFFPAVPSETLVISAGVFAATGEPNLFAVIGVAALGAFAGDHVSYMIGRTAGGRLLDRAKPDSKKAAALQRGGKLLSDRGGTIVIVCRYIPGARTAITLSAGALQYPLRKFSLFDGIAALSWGTYSALVGYIGGAAFEEEPFKGLALGLGLALSVTLVVEVVRHLRRRPQPCPS